MAEIQRFLDPIIKKVRSEIRQGIFKIPPNTRSIFVSDTRIEPDTTKKDIEPLTNIRARTDGKNVAISLTIPLDRDKKSYLDLESIARYDPNLLRVLQRNFNYPNNDRLLRITRNRDGILDITFDNENIVKKIDQKNNRYVLHGEDGSRLSIYIHDSLPHQLTEREKLIMKNNPQIRRIHNEAWLNSKQTPTANVPEDYNEELDGDPLSFLIKHRVTAEGIKFAPFCPDRDKYWGIALRDPHNSIELLDTTDVYITKSDARSSEHVRMPFDMPKTYLTRKKVFYLKPEIVKGAKTVSTEGETGVIYLENKEGGAFYYVTQPIPYIENNVVTGYFVLIGRKADLIPEKYQLLKQFFDSNNSLSS